MDRITVFTDLLATLGIPVFGVSGSGPTCRIDFKPEATAAQIAQGNAERGTFDWRKRQPKDYAALMTEINGLLVTDRTKLINAVLAEFLREHPVFARKFSVAVDGDEPV
jgi:hypothetical protein